MPSKKHKRYKLLLDESLPPRNFYPVTNNLHNIRHIKHDFNKGGISDQKVYDLARSSKRIVVVFNKKDFKKLIEKNKPSIILLTTSLPNSQADLKICKALKGLRNDEKEGCLIYISQRKEITIRRII